MKKTSQPDPQSVSHFYSLLSYTNLMSVCTLYFPSHSYSYTSFLRTNFFTRFRSTATYYAPLLFRRDVQKTMKKKTKGKNYCINYLIRVSTLIAIFSSQAIPSSYARRQARSKLPPHTPPLIIIITHTLFVPASLLFFLHSTAQKSSKLFYGTLKKRTG